MYWDVFVFIRVYYYFWKHTVLLCGVTIYGALMRDVASASSSSSLSPSYYARRALSARTCLTRRR